MKTISVWLLALGSLLSAAAFAQSVVTTTPTSGHPTAVLAVSGSKFGNSEAVDVYVDTVDTLLLVSSATGTISGSVTIPAAAAPGQHYITAIGRHSGDAAQVAFKVSTPWNAQGFGAAHLGLNPYENTLSADNVTALGPLWEAPSGGTGATPMVNGGRVFVATSAGIQALATTTGKVLWTAIPTAYFYSSPTFSGNLVYAASAAASGTVYALSAVNGATKWSTQLPAFFYGTPTVASNVVYVACMDDKLYALNAATGAILWSYATGGSLEATPVVVNGVAYIGSFDDSVYAINAATGVLIWSYRTGGPVEDSVAVSNGIVFVGSDDDNLYAIKAGGPHAGELIWKTPTDGDIYTAPAVADNLVFVGTASGSLYAVDAATGSIEWSVATAAAIMRAPVVANGVVYASGGNDLVYAFDAYYGGILAAFQTGASFLGGPSVSDGVLYLSANGSDTYAFALGAGVNAVPGSKLPPDPGSLHPDFDLQVTGR